jgi:TRAP-type C4-dicarboxylate transport system permease small subunit
LRLRRTGALVIRALAWAVHLAFYPAFAWYGWMVAEDMERFDAWLAEQTVGAERLGARRDLRLTA